MPSIALNAYRVFTTPSVLTYVGGSLDRGLVCESITIAPDGATAIFTAPLLFMDSNKQPYYTNEIVVYAAESGGGYGPPIFRGYVDAARSVLRGEHVTITARSVWSYLREIKLSTPESYNVATLSGLTTQLSPTVYFLSDNIATFAHESRVWQPAEISTHSFSLLDSFWQNIAKLRIDPSIPMVLPLVKTHYRMAYSADLLAPVFSLVAELASPFPDIIFRPDTTFGQVMDFCTQMAPGTQVFEIFTGGGTDIWLAYPQSFGAIIAIAGGDVTKDWRGQGAGVIDLDVEVDNAGTANRIIARGAPASCAVTLMSDTADGNGYMTGLIPDWKLYEESAEGTTIDRVHGCSQYDYNTNGYTLGTTSIQTAKLVMDNPALAMPGQPEYIPGYEEVGKKWRLPNWFNLCEIEQKDDILIDQRTGASVGIQVFAEVATQHGTFDFLDGNGETPIYYYTWVPLDGWQFNAQTRTLMLRDMVLTNHITNTDKSINVELGAKMARIALTFTYSHPSYTLVADSYLDAGGALPSSLLTGIQTGQVFDFEDPDLGYTQISNIGMPLTALYAEKVPTPGDAVEQYRVFPTPSPTGPFLATYGQFLIAAKTYDGPNTYNANAVLAYVDDAFTRENLNSKGTLVTPLVLRDDSAKLRYKCRQMQYLKGRKPRRITCTLNQLTKYARRGMTLGVANIRYLNSFAGDIIDTVEHDMRRGFTTIRTTNQPADEMVESVVSG